MVRQKCPYVTPTAAGGKIKPDGEESGLLKLAPPLTGQALNHCRLPTVEKWSPQYGNFLVTGRTTLTLFMAFVFFPSAGESHEIVSVAIRIKLPQNF